MKIDEFDLDKDILIIAEIGNNHEGSYTLAQELIGLAAEAGVDVVKFQTIIPERLVSVQQTDRIKQLKRFQLSFDEFSKLSEVAKKEGVIFLSTPFDLDSALFLNDIVPAFKIASGDNDFFPLIEVISKTGKPIIMSTGLMNLDEINKSVLFINNIWKESQIKQELALLHCVSSYPTLPEQANLLAIRELEEISDIVGYSDHTLGIEAAVLSVALGVKIIEKHFTLDKNFSAFHDHLLSADPKEMKEMVIRIRAVEKYLGTGEKIPQESELQAVENSRRSIVAGCDLKRGAILKWENLTWLRPGGGLAPGRESEIVGKRLIRSISKDEYILPKYLEAI